MAFHINFEGKVGRCTARTACPFGDFETQHYTTEEQARRAYELSQEGKSVAVALSRDVYFEERNEAAAKSRKAEKLRQRQLDAMEERKRKEAEEKARAEAKKKEKYRRWLSGLKTPSTQIPEDPPVGYFKTSIRPKPGTRLVDGGVVTEFHKEFTDFTTSYVVTYQRPNGKLNRAELSANAFEKLSEETVWVEEQDPELVKARHAALNERSAEDFFLNFADIKRPPSMLFLETEEGRAARRLTSYYRIFKASAKKYKKAGMSFPYTRALKDAEMSNGDILAKDLTHVAMGGTYTWGRNQRAFRLIYDEGRVPGLDFSLKEKWAERVEAGLVKD